MDFAHSRMCLFTEVQDALGLLTWTDAHCCLVLTQYTHPPLAEKHLDPALAGLFNRYCTHKKTTLLNRYHTLSRYHTFLVGTTLFNRFHTLLAGITLFKFNRYHTLLAGTTLFNRYHTVLADTTLFNRYHTYQQ